MCKKLKVLLFQIRNRLISHGIFDRKVYFPVLNTSELLRINWLILSRRSFTNYTCTWWARVHSPTYLSKWNPSLVHLQVEGSDKKLDPSHKQSREENFVFIEKNGIVRFWQGNNFVQRKGKIRRRWEGKRRAREKGDEKDKDGIEESLYW